MTTEPLVTLREGAELIGRKVKTLATWVRVGHLRAVCRSKGRSPRDYFRRSDVLAVAERMAEAPLGRPCQDKHEPSAEELERMIAEQMLPENLPAWWHVEARREKQSPRGLPAVVERYLIARRAGFRIRGRDF